MMYGYLTLSDGTGIVPDIPTSPPQTCASCCASSRPTPMKSARSGWNTLMKSAIPADTMAFPPFRGEMLFS